MQSEQLFEAALGVGEPWYVRESQFDAAARTLTIIVDFRAGSLNRPGKALNPFMSRPEGVERERISRGVWVMMEILI